MEKLHVSRNIIIWLVLIFSSQVMGQAWVINSNLNDKTGVEKIEKIYRYAIGKAGIAFQVSSGGCTNKESFRIDRFADGNETRLNLVRIVPDYCKARMPGGTLILYSFDELNLDPNAKYSIENPIDPED